MGKTFIDSITDDDIENIGLSVLSSGRGKDGSSRYIQCCDAERIFDDGKFICHYEILHMGKNDIASNINHKKGNIYVEIHFERKSTVKSTNLF